MKLKGSLLPLALLPLALIFLSRKSESAEPLPNPDGEVPPPDLLTERTDPEGAMLFDEWIQDPDYGGPYLTDDDLRPAVKSRKLTNYERWVLAPYFYGDDLTNATIKNGMRPPLPDPDMEVPPELLGATDGHSNIWIPHAPRSFTDRFWLSVLAHELYHVGQIRIGMVKGEYIDAQKTHGYYASPIEVSARWKQREVFEGVTARARAFFESMG